MSSASSMVMPSWRLASAIDSESTHFMRVRSCCTCFQAALAVSTDLPSWVWITKPSSVTEPYGGSATWSRYARWMLMLPRLRTCAQRSSMVRVRAFENAIVMRVSCPSSSGSVSTTVPSVPLTVFMRRRCLFSRCGVRVLT